jgi:hypothetical protein
MFTIFSHQGNANPNYFEIPSHLSENGYLEENITTNAGKDVVGKRNSYVLLVRM